MSKMNLKSTLWTLAFAVAAVSCSDELEGGPNNPQEEGVDGPTAKINVAISTETITRAATKATPGEDGDGVNVAEVGDEDEYTVEDVTIILYKASTSANPESWAIKGDCQLVAAGWTNQIGVMENSGATTGNKFPNGKMTTVEVAVKDDSPSLADEDGETYGVIAVTNLGQTDGEGLVAKIGAKENGYSTVADLDKALYQNSTTYNDDKVRHVMSTHAIDGSEGPSTVTFKTSDTEIPSTSVYVERLSAKIRLSEYSDNNFTYKIKATMFEEDEAAAQANAEDEIVLTDVAVFNRLKSGSFLLKRVSAAVTGGADLGKDDTNDAIIGDETASAGVATNFVIDPWTRSKTLDKNGAFPTTLPTYESTALDYTNRYTASNYGQLWQTWSGTSGNTTAISTDKLDDQGDLFLCYTQENTLSIAGSVHGYTTGALFKATYYPAKWMALVTEDVATKGDVVAEEITYGTPKSIEKFYTYTSNGKEMIFENYDAILGYIIAKAGKDVSYYSFTNVSDVNFGTNIAKLRAYADEDPFGYIEKMVAEYDKAQTEPAGTASYQAIDAYLKSFTPTAGDATTAFNERVKIYTDGVCYYPYLILHGGDGKRPTTPMEFGIVRNNIYDMTVSDISGLGYSEVDVTDPKEPDIDEKLKIQVKLYVKNWVVRSNSGIVL